MLLTIENDPKMKKKKNYFCYQTRSLVLEEYPFHSRGKGCLFLNGGWVQMERVLLVVN